MKIQFNITRRLKRLLLCLMGVIALAAVATVHAKSDKDESVKEKPSEKITLTKKTDLQAPPAHNPFDHWSAMHRYVDQLFNQPFDRFFSNGAGPLNGGNDPLAGWMSSSLGGGFELRDQDGYYVVEMDLPGMDKSSIDIHLENRALKVSAERIQEEEKTEGTTVLSSSRRHGKVTRTVTLPGLVDPKKTEAHYENGVLTITLPKVAGAESGTRIELS